jgi:hypothetical protein
MLGTRSARSGGDAADHPYLDHVGRDTFSGVLAAQGSRLFRDEDFAALSCPDNGRPRVPPRLLAIALLLQTYEGISDEEPQARADVDPRWKAAIGIGLDARPFAKRALQLFRAQLILHDQVPAVFQTSLTFARETGYRSGRKITAVLDTSYILGRWAGKDTYIPLSDGIVALSRALAHRAGSAPEDWAAAHALARYFGSSPKGEAAIAWDDTAARPVFRQGVVADADRLLELARPALADLPPDAPEHGPPRPAAELLPQLLVQDIERRPDGAALRQGAGPTASSRSTTRRCATAARVRGGASTDTRAPSPSARSASSSPRRRCGRATRRIMSRPSRGWSRRKRGRE